MTKLWLGILGATVVATAAAAPTAGGWAVVSVRQVPDAWIASRPLELAWDVRQHGVNRLDDLRPTIEARSGTRRVVGTAWANDRGAERSYGGRITLPDAGEWTVTVHSGFGRSRAELLPVRVVNADTRVAAPTEAERGRRAFAALGCVTCHTHGAVGVRGEVADVGPDLTDRRLAADYLARYLADPSIKPPSDGRRMPNLALGPREIQPLVAFLTAGRQQARR